MKEFIWWNCFFRSICWFLIKKSELRGLPVLELFEIASSIIWQNFVFFVFFDENFSDKKNTITTKTGGAPTHPRTPPNLPASRIRVRPSGTDAWVFSTWAGTFLHYLSKVYLSKLPLPVPLPLALFFSLFIFLGGASPQKNKQWEKQSQWQWKWQWQLCTV